MNSFMKEVNAKIEKKHIFVLIMKNKKQIGTNRATKIITHHYNLEFSSLVLFLFVKWVAKFRRKKNVKIFINCIQSHIYCKMTTKNKSIIKIETEEKFPKSAFLVYLMIQYYFFLVMEEDKWIPHDSNYVLFILTIY